MERKTLENSKEARDHAVLVGLRSPVLGDDSADEESLMELSELVDTAGGDTAGIILQSRWRWPLNWRLSPRSRRGWPSRWTCRR